MEQAKYDVFISYSRKDYVDSNFNVIPGNVVSKVKEALTAASISYWFDEEGIYSGQNFVEKIVTNIEASKIFLFLSTANSNISRWTCKEIASADEFGKHIIPVRIDQTPYNRKVLFRIADLDYIEYYSNPEKGMNDMMESIKSYLAQLESEEKRRKEEEAKKKEEEYRKAEETRKKKEEEAKRREEEQLKFITNLRLSCTTLNNEETKLEIDRTNLLLSAEKIIDAEQRDALKQFIINSSPIFRKYRKESQALMDKIANLKKNLSSKVSDSNVHTSTLKEKEALIAKLQKEVEQTKQQVEQLQTENDKLSKIIKELEKGDGMGSNSSSLLTTINGKKSAFWSYVAKNAYPSGVLAASIVLLGLSFIPSIYLTISTLSCILIPLLLILLLIGLIRPSSLSMNNRVEVIKFFLPALLFVFIAFGVASMNAIHQYDNPYDKEAVDTIAEVAQETADKACDSVVAVD